MARYFPDAKLAVLFRSVNMLSLIALLLATVNNHRYYGGYLLPAVLEGAAIFFMMYYTNYTKGKIKTDREGQGQLRLFHFIPAIVVFALAVALLLAKTNHLAVTYLLNIVLIGVAIFFIVLFFNGGKIIHTKKNSDVQPPSMFRPLLLLSAAIVILGLLFKVDHLPGGLFLINVGLLASVVCYLALAFKIKTSTATGAAKKKGEGMFMISFLIMLSVACVLIGLLFRINRSPGGMCIFLSTGIAGFIVAFIWAFILIAKKKTSKQQENSNP